MILMKWLSIYVTHLAQIGRIPPQKDSVTYGVPNIFLRRGGGQEGKIVTYDPSKSCTFWRENG